MSAQRRRGPSSERSTKTTEPVRYVCQAEHLSATISELTSKCIWTPLNVSFGVVKAFLDADLLPRVITGTSAGGIIAALCCTRTDEELKHLLVPELANKITACEDAFGVWIKRWYQTGARFSAIKWAEKVSTAYSKEATYSLYRPCSSRMDLSPSRRRTNELDEP